MVGSASWLGLKIFILARRVQVPYPLLAKIKSNKNKIGSSTTEFTLVEKPTADD